MKQVNLYHLFIYTGIHFLGESTYIKCATPNFNVHLNSIWLIDQERVQIYYLGKMKETEQWTDEQLMQQIGSDK